MEIAEFTLPIGMSTLKQYVLLYHSNQSLPDFFTKISKSTKDRKLKF